MGHNWFSRGSQLIFGVTVSPKLGLSQDSRWRRGGRGGGHSPHHYHIELVPEMEVTQKA